MKPTVLFLATLALTDASPRTVPFVEFGHTFRKQSSASLAKATKKLAYQDGEATRYTRRAAKLFKSKSGGEHTDLSSEKTIVISEPSRESMSYSLHALSSSKSSKSTNWYESEPRGIDSSMSYALSADHLSMNYLSMNFDESPVFASKSSKGADSSMSLVYANDMLEEGSNEDSEGNDLVTSTTLPPTLDSATATSISSSSQTGQPGEEESEVRQDVFGKIM